MSKKEGQGIDIVYEKLNHEPPQLNQQIKKWTFEKLGNLTTLQQTAIPLIKQRKSTLIVAPTGSGKTLAAFLGIIDELQGLHERGELNDKVYVLYISPLKALNNDIAINLQKPLEEMGLIRQIRVSVRTGDTSSYEKSKMLKIPPHILITTPESLGIALASKRFKELLRGIEWIIIDEIHDLAATKRGTLLSLCLEWVSWLNKKDIPRIGISATVSPIPKICQFLEGMGKNAKKVHVVQTKKTNKVKVEVIAPTNNLEFDRFEMINNRLIDHILKEIEKHQTTIIFANTRKWTEHLTTTLLERSKGRLGGKIAVHHGSIDKSLRLEAERKLKSGELRAVVTSTSLELGIDIGDIDLAIQWGSPKEVATAVQRIGRSGHTLSETSHGHILSTDIVDLLEILTIRNLIYEGKIEEIQIPEEPLDVLAQIIVGLSLEQAWDVKKAFSLIKRAYPYRNMEFELFLKLLEAMDSPTAVEEKWKYGRIWFDKEKGKFGKKGMARQNFMMNIGTIPDVSSIQVVHEMTREKIGTISERFAEKLSHGDIFVLGGTTYKFLRSVGNKIIVKQALGFRPTIPSWAGEGISRSVLVGQHIGMFLEMVRNKIIGNNEKSAKRFVEEYFGVENTVSEQIISYLKRQQEVAEIPTDKRIVVESYTDASGVTNILVLSVFGRKVNEPIAHALATAISRKHDINVGISVTDNGFALILPLGFQFKHTNLFGIIQTERKLDDYIKESIEQTEQFKLRFRHVAVRSLMVLKRSPKFTRTPEQQHQMAQRLLKFLEPNFPLLQEVEKEIFTEIFDLEKAKQVVDMIHEGKIEVKYIDGTGIPSPMTHPILVTSTTDVILMQNRRALLLSLHKQVIGRLMEREIQLERDAVDKYFKNKLESPEFTEKRRWELWQYRSGLGMDPKNVRNGMKGFVYNGRIVSKGQLIALSVLKGCKEIEEYPKGNSPSEEIENIKSLVKKMKTSEASRHLVYNLIFSRGPLTSQEISHLLEIDDQLVESALDDLQNNGEVIGGYIYDQTRRYISKIDHERLLLQVSKKHIHERNQFSERLKKLIISTGDNSRGVEEIIEETGPIRNIISIYLRHTSFRRGEVLQAMENGRVYFGRFWGGKNVFVTAPQAKRIIEARERQDLDIEEKDILELIGKNKGISFVKLKELTNMDNRKLREILRYLEWNLYIGQIGEGVIDQFTQKKNYVLLPFARGTEKSRLESQEMIVQDCIFWYGTVSIDEIIGLTKLPFEVVETAIEELKSKEKIELIEENGMVLFRSKITRPHIKQKSNMEVLLVPWDDPLFLLRGRLRQEWIHPRSGSLAIIFGSEAIGSMDYIHLTRDHLQVVQIQVKKILTYDPVFLELLAKQVLSYAKQFFMATVISVEEMNGKPFNDSALALTTSIFLKQGFQLDNDYLVSQRQVSVPLSGKDIVELKLLGIIGKRKETEDLDTFIRTFNWFSKEKIVNHFHNENIEPLLNQLVKEKKLHYEKGVFTINKKLGMKELIIGNLRHNVILSLEELESAIEEKPVFIFSALADLIKEGEVRYLLNEDRKVYYYHILDEETILEKNRGNYLPNWWTLKEIPLSLLETIKQYPIHLSGVNMIVLHQGQPKGCIRSKEAIDTFQVIDVTMDATMSEKEIEKFFGLIEKEAFDRGLIKIEIQRINGFRPEYWLEGQ